MFCFNLFLVYEFMSYFLSFLIIHTVTYIHYIFHYLGLEKNHTDIAANYVSFNFKLLLYGIQFLFEENTLKI